MERRGAEMLEAKTASRFTPGTRTVGAIVFSLSKLEIHDHLTGE
jgi:hypothetical protein